ncbi:hypothetical protein ACT4WO_20050 (plasmid) [Acinetobacter baumannii]
MSEQETNRSKEQAEIDEFRKGNNKMTKKPTRYFYALLTSKDLNSTERVKHQYLLLNALDTEQTGLMKDESSIS